VGGKTKAQAGRGRAGTVAAATTQRFGPARPLARIDSYDVSPALATAPRGGGAVLTWLKGHNTGHRQLSAVATDLVEGFKPDRIRGFRSRLLALRSKAGLAQAIHARLLPVYAAVVPSLAGEGAGSWRYRLPGDHAQTER